MFLAHKVADKHLARRLLERLYRACKKRSDIYVPDLYAARHNQRGEDKIEDTVDALCDDKLGFPSVTVGDDPGNYAKKEQRSAADSAGDAQVHGRIGHLIDEPRPCRLVHPLPHGCGKLAQPEKAIVA